MTKKGGKIKSSREINRDIRRGWKKNIANPVNKDFLTPAGKTLAKVGTEVGKFTNNQLLPGLVSVGIPLASTALGMLGAEAGIPPELTSKLSSNIMKRYIPKQYQSKNKYVGLLGDALNMGISGADPESMSDFAGNLTGAISSDLRSKPKIKKPTQITDNPYNDAISQIMSNYQPQEQVQEQPQETDNNQDLNNPIDNTISNQKMGSYDGLMGEGLKKKRGRRRKQPIEVIIKKSSDNFRKPKNASLEQLLNATAERQEKQDKIKMRETLDRQNRALIAAGY